MLENLTPQNFAKRGELVCIQPAPVTPFMLPLAHEWLNPEVLIRTEAACSLLHEPKGQMSRSLQVLGRVFHQDTLMSSLPEFCLIVAKNTGADPLLSGILTMKCLH